jgi:hypothetical protein
MTHPIDPLTPNAITARHLWNLARDGDSLHFIDEWEGMITDHEKALEWAFNDGRSDGSAYENGYQEGLEYGKDIGYDRGYQEAWREAEEKIRAITGERLTPDS